ncbi:uncharacterized protein LOC121729091 [Aricia agestis]|uniref:uncharacterized protein LOC121729091 n=1 Tax=Aricia agestis TaxID=91739 RepID=UPI001C20821B|nr:uncharacterized protein LOC121729091 [Aricia agestis]
MTTSTTSTEKVPKDCTACRLTGAVGLVGIGAYLANIAWKNKTTPGKLVISTLSLAFMTLGVQRYKNEFPFHKVNSSLKTKLCHVNDKTAPQSQPARPTANARNMDKSEDSEAPWGTPSTASVLPPQAYRGEWDSTSNAWSAALGAMGGAGTVLIIAALLLIFRRPRRSDQPVLAPMDVGQNSIT